MHYLYSKILGNCLKNKFFTISFVLLFMNPLFSGTTGKLSGVLTDKETGDPLIGANVMIEGTPLGAATDINGSYYVLQVPPGAYKVKFTMIGYQTLIMNDVRIRVDLTTNLDGQLSQSAVGLDEVIVQADRPMIQTDVTYSQANISSEEVDMLPVEEFTDVLSLQAGVVTTGGEIHVRGGRGGEISYMVDGITVTDPYNSGIAVEIENNSIQELLFISGTLNAEYGQAMSGIVNIVTKDGNYEKYSGSISGNIGDYFIAKDPIFPKADKENWNDISDMKANIEGPIIPGRMSFFISGRKKRNNGYLFGERVFHPNSYSWSDEQNMWIIDHEVGLGDDFVPVDSLWAPINYQDSLASLIKQKRNNGDFNWESMSWSDQSTYQAKLSLRITPKMRLGYNRMHSDTRSQAYSHAYRWNPDGRPFSFNTRVGDIARVDMSFNQSTFANLMFSKAVNHFRTHLSDNPNYYEIIDNIDYASDWGYAMLDTSLYDTDPRIDDYATGNNFEVGGNYMGIYNRMSDVRTLKAELTSQLSSVHQAKMGAEYRSTKIKFNDITVLQAPYTGYAPVILEPEDNTIHNSFQSLDPFSLKQVMENGDTTWTGNSFDGRNPIELSFYLQDKMEADDMVVNVGIRYDYFDSQFWVLNDPEDPNYLSPLKPINKWEDIDGDGQISDEEMKYSNLKSDSDRLSSNANGKPWFKKAEPKTQISPRFALAFPITDKGYLHFSYGHFFQNPSFSYIYDNPEFEVPAASGVNSTMGNANMEPQRTTQYEVGFSQQFGRDIGLEITGYYKDIRNLNATEIKNSFIAGDRYGMYVNKDHANSKGLTLAISKRSSQKFSGNFDYTFSVSEGNASDPTAAFYDEQSDIEPEKMLIPLDWDQRHTINGTATYHLSKSSGASIVFNYGSGFPYTTTNADGQRTSFENNGRRPPTYNVDMRAFHNVALSSSIQLSFHVNIYNLFDIRNELTVYGDTGRASYSLVPTYTPQYSGPMLNTLDEFLVVPSYYSAPRQVKIGLSILWR